ncbi:hypothetical protein CYY_010526 [Polysphondylium violaceum]|uniref:HP domain-containing protein n=1 Tax=Polysphondylium violaceum TaxID=133409 RepID=A0A8J4PKI8_9MYCE|nr:hypothetical protein CYY_010526 [Polysphondylium violaceum]
MSMELATEYSATLTDGRKNVPVFVIYYGKEPYIFTCVFHGWDFSKRILPTISFDKDIISAKEILDLYTKRYSYDDIVNKPYPKGIDGSRLEEYLPDEEFMKIFRMTLSDFQRLPLWKEQTWKKELRLYNVLEEK